MCPLWGVGGVIWTQRGEGLEVMVRVQWLPVTWHKRLINPLQSQVRSLIGPGEQPALEMKLFECSDIEEFSELTHPPTVEIGVVFVFGTDGGSEQWSV
jgi:hypothetical protein